MKMSIGEMAKLNNISVQTLRYYDKIDLLKPSEVDPDSNYRYYDQGASNVIWKIKLLKSTGLSLEEIKEYINGDIEVIEKIFRSKREQVMSKIERLNTVVSFIDNQVEKFEGFRKLDLILKPEIKYFDKRVGYLIDVNDNTNFNDTIRAIMEFEKEKEINSTEINFNPTRLNYIGDEGQVVLKNYLALKRDGERNKSNESKYGHKVYTLKLGDYVIIDKVGISEPIEKTYESLFKYIKIQGREVEGEGIELLTISKGLSSNDEECLTQIQILLK